VAPKLVNFCLACAFVLGSWGGVIAAAACPHAGCQTAVRQEPADHGHSCESASEEQARPAPEVLRAAVSSPHDPFCSHCSGRPPTPPSAKSEWQLSPVQKVEKDSAAQSVGHLPSPRRARTSEIRPSQHAPPHESDRRLLLNVFRI
jgi:hypothetical protein